MSTPVTQLHHQHEKEFDYKYQISNMMKLILNIKSSLSHTWQQFEIFLYIELIASKL